jgi:hypothetical protein
MYIPFWELARKPDKRYYLWLGQGTFSKRMIADVKEEKIN